MSGFWGRLAAACVAAEAAGLALGRLFWGHREPSWRGSYEASAHVFVGGLLAYWLAGFQMEPSRRGLPRLCGWLALALSALELAAFFWTR